MEEMIQMKFKAPDENTPGFLKRMRRAAKFAEAFQGNDVKLSVKLVDELTEFLVDFIYEPADREQAKDALLDATQTQYMDMLNAVMGANKEPVPLVK